MNIIEANALEFILTLICIVVGIKAIISFILSISTEKKRTKRNLFIDPIVAIITIWVLIPPMEFYKSLYWHYHRLVSVDGYQVNPVVVPSVKGNHMDIIILLSILAVLIIVLIVIIIKKLADRKSLHN